MDPDGVEHGVWILTAPFCAIQLLNDVRYVFHCTLRNISLNSLFIIVQGNLWSIFIVKNETVINCNDQMKTEQSSLIVIIYSKIIPALSSVQELFRQ